jgi:hypothetical protein
VVLLQELAGEKKFTLATAAPALAAWFAAHRC